MTLHIIHSNKVERLHDELCHLLKNHPLKNPFQAETIVCPSQAMARWLNIRFAMQLGIAAHYDYPMPASWLWQFASSVLHNVPQQDPLQKEVMAWRLFHLIELNKNKPSFETLKQYLADDKDTTKRWSLAKKIATVFERYQHFRADLLTQWSDAKAGDWQAELWQQLTQNIQSHRVALLNQLGMSLSADALKETLPERVTFFSLSSLPPLLLKCIQELAKHTEVYFFVLSPSAHYWSDFVSLKKQAKKRLNDPELNDYFTTGHELLASWGRQGQVFQDMLLHELDDEFSQPYDAYCTEFNGTLLQRLQQSLFELENFDLENTTVDVEDDKSIQINGCHSPLRECEVLHDQCLTLLENPDISPEDILVIVPAIERYAPSIEAVFKKSHDQEKVKPFIPWNISDTSLRAENQLIRSFLELLKLSSSRFTASDLLSFLDCSAILKRFKLEETDKPIIREYIQRGHINWGLNAAHKTHFDMPQTTENTWQQANEHFFNAYAIDEQSSDEYESLAGFSSSRALVIAQFLFLLDTLDHWRLKLNYPRSFKQWQNDLNECIDAFFSDFDEKETLQSIRDSIDELMTHANDKTEHSIQRELIQQCLTESFEASRSSQYFFSGGITFCGMRPMRSLPFKVIVMLGMNEIDFPRQNNAIEFDQMVSNWQPGDLLISDEDRYLFLEALLCARHSLIISYCSKSLKDNTDKQPSNLVSELCDYLDSHFKPVDTTKNITDSISNNFAMHSYSSDNYSDCYRSYNQFWADVAEQVKTSNLEPNLELVETISPPLNEQDKDNSIELSRLIKSLKDPIKHYCQSQLKLYLAEHSDTQDDEIFELNALQKWHIKDQLLTQQIQQKLAQNNQLNHQSQTLPHGSHAHHAYQSLADDANEQLSPLDHYNQQQPATVLIAIKLSDDTMMNGNIHGYYAGLGLLKISASKFGAKNLLDAWFEHCALCVMGVLSADEITMLSCQNGLIRFKPLPENDARKILSEAVDLMQQIEKEPLTLFPKSSFIYQFKLMTKDENTALTAAISAWHGNSQNEAAIGEKENEYIQLNFNEFKADPSELFDSEEFISLASQFYQAALQHAEIEGEVAPK